MKRKIAFRKKKQNRLGMFLVMLVIIMLLAAVAGRSVQLRAKQEEYTLREKELEKQIAEEEKRTQEIEQYGKYTETKKYIEEVAKDKLGLVYDGEIVFKEE